MTRGKFITLEGGEGVGKTTSLGAVAHYLQSRNVSLIVTREPGGTAFGESLRSLVLTAEGLCSEAELLLMFAARAQHIREVINPALSSGQWVLADRFSDASFAYQGGGRGIPDEKIAALESWDTELLQPDLTFLLDAPVEVGLARARARGKPDRFETERLPFFERVRLAYLRRARLYSDRMVLVDAIRSPEAVSSDICQQLARRFSDDFPAQ